MTSPTPPRVLRYRSSATGNPAFGLVLEEQDGIAQAALNLTAKEPALGSTFDAFRAHRGFEIAAQVWKDPDTQGSAERISPAQVLPPVDISDAEILDRRKFIISMGLNYESHRRETSRGTDLLMVNAAGTTGPYDPLRLVPEAQLVDYEAEVGCVLLDDVDLSAAPPMEDLEPRLAYFVVNDLNDRAPMILDEKAGYTAGKSDPGFVPIGPWMVHGAALPIFSQRLGLEVSCTVTQRGQAPRIRQRDRTTGVIRDPAAILRLLGEQLAADPTMAHPDRRGTLHPFARLVGDRFILPAGSLVLTGTPGGTCIRAPKGLAKLPLLIRGGFTMAGARRAYVRDQVRARREIGYLLPGDLVETAVEGLGKQRWEIEP